MCVHDGAVDLLIVGAGPAGSAAAFHAAQRGRSVVLIDASTFPRDKTCGDGLTPRAMKELETLGLAETLATRYRNQGLYLHGFGGSVQAAWPNSSFGRVGSAMKRSEFDTLLFHHAASQEGVSTWTPARARSAVIRGGRITEVSVVRETDSGRQEHTVRPRTVVVADGVRSTFGKQLGRKWHKDQVYGIAARAYCETSRSTDPWLHSHVELTDEDGSIQPGYGWIFPLGTGEVNIGCGALSTQARPARMNTKKLLRSYVAQQSAEWDLGEPQQVSSALLPMGGAVTGVAGVNWMLIGDAAALVNPLNGEGIDYGMESARLAVELMGTTEDLTYAWPQLLRDHYGDAFRLARRLARVLTYPRFLPLAGPVAMRGLGARTLMPAAARLMGNLVSDEDRDLVARMWRLTQKSTARIDASPLWQDPPRL